MNGDREETFSIEIPRPEHTSLVTRIERSAGREGYFGIALDLADALDAGQHRAALTLVEARDLHAALHDALAGFTDQS